MYKKYYAPDIAELYIGFELEHKNPMQENKWKKEVVDSDMWNIAYSTYEEEPEDYPNEIRVKYLDREDIESLGFTDKHYDNIQSKDTFFKIKENNVYQITVYWNMLRNERENLIRIYKGKLHNYPYTEIFRGDIKNKSELKKLLKIIA